MVIEVIYSHHLDEGRGMIEVEFSMCEDDDGCQDHMVEIEVEEEPVKEYSFYGEFKQGR